MNLPLLPLLLALSLTTPIFAQISAIPSCALTCITTGLSSDSCSLYDYACHCTHVSSLWGTVTPCIKASCSTENVKQAREATLQVCKDYGVDVSLPVPSATATAIVSVKSVTSDGGAGGTSEGSGSQSPTTALTTDVATDGSPASSTASLSSPTSTGQGSTTGTSSHSEGGSKTPIGAIVGGVVGGLAILCVAGVAIFYIRRRHPHASQGPGNADTVPTLPKYEYSTAPEVAQTGQGRVEAPYNPHSAPTYGASELGGQDRGVYAAQELPAVRKE